MEKFGKVTKTTFLKGPESYKTREEFQVAPYEKSLTFSAALVADNVISMDVNGYNVTVDFDTDSDTTMQAIADALESQAAVGSAVVTEVAGADNDRVIVVTPENLDYGLAIEDAAVTGGASQATITEADTNVKGVHKGTPVMLTSEGYIAELDNTNAALNGIGVCMHDAGPGELATVALYGGTVIFAQAGSPITPGPVKFTGFNAGSHRNVFSGDTVTVTNMSGWAIDAAADAGEEIRVILK